MAALDSNASIIFKRQPFGEYFVTCFLVVITNAGAADEWVTKAITGLSDVLTAWGATHGAGLSALNFLLNCATGTGGTPQTSKGALSIEAENAGPIAYHIYCIGKV